jgi:erythromycin esterase-like protein
LGEQAQGQDPLILSGFDVRLSGRDDRLLTSELEAHLEASGSVLTGEPQWSWFRTTLDSLRKKERQLNLTDAEYDSLTSYLTRIEGEITKYVIEAARESMWRQTIKSIAGLVEFLRVPISDWKRCNTIRDLKMAGNLLWLMNTRYPGEKFILWGASYHFCRKLASDTMGYDSVLTMADSVWTVLREEMYSVAFSGFEGQVSQWDGTPKPLQRAFEASVEGLFEKAGHALAFLDLRTLPPGGQWLQDLQYARVLGNNWKHYSWPNHFDGLFFIRNIAPSTRIKG